MAKRRSGNKKKGYIKVDPGEIIDCGDEKYVVELSEEYQEIIDKHDQIKDELIGLRNRVTGIDTLEHDLKEKHKLYSNLLTQHNELKDNMESKIEDLKKELTGKKKRIKQLTEDGTYWEKRYTKEFSQWRIEPLEDEEYAYFATWINPESGKTEEYRIPRDFNPHHVKRFKRDKNDCYTIDYYCYFEDVTVDIHIPISLFEKLKDMIPKRIKKDGEKVERDAFSLIEIEIRKKLIQTKLQRREHIIEIAKITYNEKRWIDTTEIGKLMKNPISRKPLLECLNWLVYNKFIQKREQKKPRPTLWLWKVNEK